MKLPFFKDQNIEFLCAEEDWGVIPPPVPARKIMPEWYKKLASRTGSGLAKGTVKRCPPFLDAMQLGWVIPLAGDVEFKTNEDASGVDYSWSFYKPLVESHAVQQVTSEGAPNPANPKPPMKFLNYWTIRVPKGYSVMFMPLMNRPDPRFTCLSGVVECDKYFEYINFPFFFNSPNFEGVVEAGTPLVQVIPFRRGGMLSQSNIGAFTAADTKALELTRRQRASHESLYRDKLWERK